MYPMWTGKRTKCAARLMLALSMWLGADCGIDSLSATVRADEGLAATEAVTANPGPTLLTPAPTPYSQASMSQRIINADGYMTEQGYTYEYEEFPTVYYSEMEAIFLWRQGLDSVELASNQPYDPATDTVTGSTISTLNADEIGMAGEYGGRWILGRMLNDDWSMEFRYWGVVAGRSYGTLATTDNSLRSSPFLNGGVITISGTGSTDVYYSSRIHNFEWNIRRWVQLPRDRMFSTYAGIRYISVQEFMNLQNPYNQGGSGSAETGDFNSHNSAYNNLLGLNLGGTYESRPYGPISFVLFGDLLLGGNITSSSTYIFTNNYNTDGSANVSQEQRNESDSFGFTAAMGWGFKMKYQLLSQLWFNFGYEFHLLTGQALAENQLQTVPINTNQTIDDDGVLFLHGPSVGIIATW